MTRLSSGNGQRENKKELQILRQRSHTRPPFHVGSYKTGPTTSTLFTVNFNTIQGHNTANNYVPCQWSLIRRIISVSSSI